MSFVTKSLMRNLCVFVMVALLTNIPHVVLAEVATAKMIPATVVVEQLTREQAQANVDSFLKQENVRKQLVAHGLSEGEVKMRLASLSETELKQLSKQMDQARAGGDILIAILIVVLIIFLIKRI
ncbi:hypothetical protein BH10BDE1_BH10BDE1_16310 [soil metagenome]